ncbi:cytochrome c [Brumicola nitratireducens]|uniref:Cytochrome C n=1 Tax=Glaciecola nitratireducens (strain JCM 12485 / KCTC 12276 / FR1064) TaxID=1085623 RepID=G4QMK3_GLANF|nr:cytochrome c [Glaciecola nitratireducens]AEP30955.1 hypothetical protein GNIT_2858 [Glaciecola nitratireducens FR1064]
MKAKLVIGLLLVSSAALASDENIASTDARTPINLNVQQKDFVLERMRRMLETLTGIQQSLVQGSPEKVDNLVSLLFEYTRENHPDGLHDSMPVGFQQMSKQMNSQWKALAKENTDAVLIQKEIVTIMSTCNACHRSYRIE